MGRGVHRARVVAAAIALCACAGFAAIAIASGGDSPARAKAGGLVDAELVSASQKHILNSGKLEVRVEASAAAKLRLRGLSRHGDGPGSKVAKPHRTRLDAGESKTVKLKLTPDGRVRLAGCGEQEIVIKTRASQTGDRLGDRDDERDSASQKLNVDSSGCTGTGTPGDATTPGGGSGSTEPAVSDRCDPLDPSVCLYPWPNDYFTVADPSTPTGRRLNLDLLAMPRNKANVPVNPIDYNVADGFSPGNMIITKVPGLDTQQAFDNTGAVPITEVESSFDANQPVVVINADTGERQLIWSEIDANPADPADRTLIIRPAENFEEGQRYIVALRNLKDSSGNTIPAQEPFKSYRDNVPTGDPVLEARRPHMEQLFTELANATQPIARNDLYLAWDFTVSSRQNLSSRMLTMRDDAFSSIGDTNLFDLSAQGTSPQFTVDTVTNFTQAQDPKIARTVEGTVTVPCYLDLPGCPPGSRFLPGQTTPTRNPVDASANYTCIIPRGVMDGTNPPLASPSLYGHGLLGSASEVTGGNVEAMAFEHDFMFCATDWAGFATTDGGSVLAILQDVSNFPLLADRTQQGMLNFMFLGRAMIRPDGFSSNPAFQVDPDGGGPIGLRSVIDNQRLFYDGNSQGGILGGALTAVAPDFNRAVLGVPGMNYSTLLTRSSDFTPYANGNFNGIVCDELPEPFKTVCNSAPGDTPLGLYDNYPNELERPLIFSLIQLLWDRAEANGYAQHMTSDPLPNTPPHNVLMHVSFGDHQVSMWTAEVEARTIGASVHWPSATGALDEGRHPDDGGLADEPLFGIPRLDVGDYPFSGSALVYWDGTLLRNVQQPPTTNTPPMTGNDPHSYPRNDPDAREQKAAFLADPGELINVCGALPCYADGL